MPAPLPMPADACHAACFPFVDLSGAQRLLHVRMRASPAGPVSAVVSGEWLDLVAAVARGLSIPFGELLRNTRYGTVGQLAELCTSGEYAADEPRRVPLNERRYARSEANAARMRARLCASIASGYVSRPPEGPEAAALEALLEGGVHAPATPDRLKSPRDWPEPGALVAARHPPARPRPASSAPASPAPKRLRPAACPPAGPCARCAAGEGPSPTPSPPAPTPTAEPPAGPSGPDPMDEGSPVARAAGAWAPPPPPRHGDGRPPGAPFAPLRPASFPSLAALASRPHAARPAWAAAAFSARLPPRPLRWPQACPPAP